jgi:phosphopantothenoylcysteine decarboxylase
MSRVLLGVTGSVAAVRTPLLAGALAAAGHEVKVAVSEAALAFFSPADLPLAPSDLPGFGPGVVYRDADEWPRDRRFALGDPVLHIELRRWAEALVIAPLDAHTLARLALGLCDNLLTCVYRAWDPARPVVLAPAMNTLMWEHPATSRHLTQLLADHGGVAPLDVADPAGLCAAVNATCPRLRVVPPVAKVLACGDEGVGGLAPPEAVTEALGPLLTGTPSAP